MCFSRKLLAPESLNDSTESFSFSSSKNINSLETFEDLVNSDFFFEKRICEFDFVFDISSIYLDFIDIGFFGFEVESLGLSVTNESYY